ncbi:putative nuclease HARBI1 [Drosophila simulans]|uniref:putative nuclease HARBI1 n=1 Tax=Drosophila simulans TaxID=7240 RepID=UPI00192D1CEC|nr:putative nuclease HARBI1 [Drosophila simulans]
MAYVIPIACFEARRNEIPLDIRKSMHLKCNTCMFNISDQSFVKYYGIDKAMFKSVLKAVKPYLHASPISQPIQLATVLRYLVTGCTELAVAHDYRAKIDNGTLGKILNRFIPVLDGILCQDAISIQMSKHQMQTSSINFLKKYELPRVVACLFGTHVQIKKPLKNCSAFLNKKGYYSLNVMLVCNDNMEIIANDATYPGSCHDSAIWKVSRARELLSVTLNGHFILADSKYAQESFVLTPYKSAEVGTYQHTFNLKHAQGRIVFERTIGALKSRFLCLQRCLRYEPTFCCMIVNVCCALHNLRRTPNVTINDDIEFERDDNGQRDRDEIAQSLLVKD